MTYLCVSILVRSLEQAHSDAAVAAEAGAEMIEYRVDEIAEPDAMPIKALVQQSPLPCIVTCRPTWEGGQSSADDLDRIVNLAAAFDAGANYIDCELVTWENNGGVPIASPSRLILSSHDFTGRPERLYNIIRDLNAAPGTINKVVWMSRTIRDNVEAFEILQHRQKPTIALCMGEAGIISRVLAKKFGGFLTFASLDRDSATAPGQVSIHDMKRLYRWDAIGPATKVYGVVASPVMHSMSPAIHNASFDATGYDGVYLPMLVNPGYESFKAFMESFLAFGPLHLSGL
jgi:3-dehydroquinate dehydratase / shikimate dehydrogenase